MSEITRTVSRQLAKIILSAQGGEAPAFMIMNPRDWWSLRRGPNWRYPLPPRRTLAARRRVPLGQRVRRPARRVFKKVRYV